MTEISTVFNSKGQISFQRELVFAGLGATFNQGFFRPNGLNKIEITES